METKDHVWEKELDCDSKKLPQFRRDLLSKPSDTKQKLNYC